MTIPTQKQLDEVRKTGYRPTIVACCVFGSKVLMLFKKEYRLWMFVQGGVDGGELEDTVSKEVKEEMGAAFLKTCAKDIKYIGEEQIEFLPEKQTGEVLKTADKKEFKMIGKHYYFFMIPVSKEEIDLKKTEFDEYYWLPSGPALSLASKIYQPGKKRITLKAISLLKENGFIE